MHSPISKKSTLLALAGFLWLFAILVLYYTGHKPFTPQVAVALSLSVWRLLCVVLIASLAGGLGRLLLARFRLSDHLHPLSRLAVETGIGLGCFALAILLLGAAGLTRAWLFWLLTLALLIMLRKPVLSWLGGWRALAQIVQSAGRFGKLAALLLALVALASLTVALAPPVKFDALMYHLVMPAEYLRTGQVTYLPWLAMTGMPQNAEMLYTWAMALGGLPAAPALGWMVAFIAVAGLLGCLTQRLDPPSAWAGVGALLGGYTLAASMGWGYVDWFGLFFGLGALVCLDAFRQHHSARYALLAGVFAGLALGTKYPAGVLGLAAFGALLFGHVRSTPLNWKEAARTAAFYAAGAVLSSAPWLLKNLMTTGSPVYPFFFPAGAMTPVRMSIYQGMAPYGNWRDLLLLPFQATYLGFDGAVGYSVSVGPLLLGLGVLAWVGWKQFQPQQKMFVSTAAALALLGLLVWALGNRFSGFLIQTRFYYSLFPAFAALAAAGYWGLARLPLPGVRLHRIIGAVILLVLGLNAFEGWTHSIGQGAPQTVLGVMSESDYRLENLGWYEVAAQAVRALPAGSKVLLLTETRSLYCRPTCYPDEILDRWKRDWLQYQEIDAVLDAWRAEGFTHILFYRAGAEFNRQTADPHFLPVEWDALDRFLAALPEPAHFDDVYELYHIP